MSITFNTNISALGTQRYLNIASDNTSSSLAKLSSGSRVPTAKDDAAALAVGTQLKAQVAGLTQASLNASQASSVLQIADGALSTTADILTRMETLAVQASSGQLSDSDRSLLNQEYTSLQSEVDRIANVTNFNGKDLLAGSTQTNTQINNLAANTTANPTSATNLLGTASGIDSINFTDNFNGGTTGAVSLSYTFTDNSGAHAGSHAFDTDNNLTATNLVTGAKQTIAIGNTAVAAGSTASYNFSSLGLSVTLNSQFNKATAISGVNTAGVSTGATGFAVTTPSATLGTPGLTGPTASTASISAIAFNGTGNNQIDTSALIGQTIALSGASTAVTLGNLSVGGHTFINTTGTHTFAAAGPEVYSFDDGQGNTFSVTITTTGAATAGTASGSLSIGASATAPGGAIQTGAVDAPKVLSLTESTTLTAGVSNAANFGKIDDASVTIDATTASAAAFAISVGGVAFTGTANLTTTGAKSVDLADANGNKITIGFTVTSAFADGDKGHITLASLGQVAGAEAQTTGSTSFSFKVGTGTSDNDSVSFTLSAATQTALGIDGTSIDTADNANDAITAVTNAITTVSSNRASIGASESRLSFAKASVDVAVQNTTAAESGLLDVDVSSEITKFTSQQVLLQAGVSLLAQANQQPALLLKLLQ